MTPRGILRTRFGIDDESTDSNASKVNDEEILNVLRREQEKDDGEDELTTKEIAEQLPIGSKQTHNRLSDLKEKSRVEKRRAGRIDMWNLAPSEPDTVMNPDLGPIVEQSSRARRKAVDIKRSGIQLCAGGFVFLIIGMTLLMSELSPFPFAMVGSLAFGYSLGIVGSFFIMVATVLRLAGLIAPRAAERFLLD